ncbi:MAG: 1-acyl-sn-glycerol-3-phosphate acyltransferase [Nanoarchaeota archaeon]|nr:1-acyl-sn-glycerol-3-phosphate acyltransferase [Nanoarchaeota archaeon]
MDYIQRFLSDEEPKKLSALENIALSLSAIKQVDMELLNSNYEHRLKELYYPEEKIVKWLDTFNQSFLWQFFEKYFKPRLYNAENIPDKTGAMLVANHSTIFLADMAPIYFGVHEQKRRCVYGMAYRMFGNSDFLKTIGGVKGKMENAVRLLNDDKLVIVCPGGILDACKPFYDRYLVRHVEGFAPEHCGYIKAAYQANKPIIPVGVVGAEETLFTLADMKPLVKKIMGWLDRKYSLSKKPKLKELYQLVDFAKVVPLPLNLLPFKSNVDAYAGKPIDVRAIVGNNPSQKKFADANSVVMMALQGIIDKGLGKRRDMAHLSGIFKGIRETAF